MENQLMPESVTALEMPQMNQNRTAGGCGCSGETSCRCRECSAPKNTRSNAGQFVYAIGRIYPRYPNLGVEKEVAQALGSEGGKGANDEQALHKILRDPNFLYIAQEMCWTVAIETIDSYVIKPATKVDAALLLESLREDKDRMYFDVIVGRVGEIAPANLCNGAMLPLIDLIQLYSFDRAALVRQLSKPKDLDEKVFQSAIKQTLDVVGRMSGNLGASDGHRAINYLVTRYAELYNLVARQLLDNASLDALSVRPSEISGSRRVYDVVLTFKQRGTIAAIQNFSARVDTTDIFPFLVSPLAPYFERG